MLKKGLPDMGTSIDIIVTSEETKSDHGTKSQLSNKDYDKLVKSTRFSEYEIVQLWNSFKQDFPSGQLNKKQLSLLVKKVFPKCNEDLVTENIFRIFDPDETGSIRFNELLMAFSMSMRGTVEEKLKWAFKLYDKDGSGEIDKEEMEDIFTKLCAISSGPSPTTMKKRKEEKEAKEAEEARQKLAAEQKKKKQMKKKYKNVENIAMLSSRRLRGGMPEPKPRKTFSAVKVGLKLSMNGRAPAGQEEDKDKTEEAEEVDAEVPPPVDPKLAQFLEDPERDCTKFDVRSRAHQLFDALDEDGSGSIDQDEFVDGCMLDEVFVQVLDEFDGSSIWGNMMGKK